MFYEFSPREKKIIAFLESHFDWQTGNELSKLTGVSSRTIRSDILRINGTLQSIDLSDSFRVISEHSKGYKFAISNQDTFTLFIKDINYDADSFEREMGMQRGQYIRLFAVLVNNPSIETIALRLYCSEQAIRKSIKDSNIASKKQKWKIGIKNGIVFADGKEINIRTGILRTIFLNPGFRGITDDLRSEITDEKFDYNVYTIIRKSFRANEFLSFSEACIQYLVKALYVCVTRNRNGHKLKFEQSGIEMINRCQDCHAIAESIVRDVNKGTDNNLNENDTLFLTILLASFHDSKNQKEVQPMSECEEMICKDVFNKICTDFIIRSQSEKQRLYLRLSNYFSSFEIRTMFSTPRQYMGITRIKRRMITASEYSRYLCIYLKHKYGIVLRDTEVTFLAETIHTSLSCASSQIKGNIAISSQYGIGEAQRIKDEIIIRWPDLFSEISVFECYDLEKVDHSYERVLVDDKELCSQNTEKYVYYPSYSSAFFWPEDIKLKAGIIRDSHLSSIIFENSIETMKDINTKDDVIRKIAEKLSSTQKMQNSLIKQIKEMSFHMTFECGFKFALITLVKNVVKDEARIIILDKPILWNTKLVQGIILLNLRDYSALLDYEMGLKDFLPYSDKCSTFLNQPTIDNFKNLLIAGRL